MIFTIYYILNIHKVWKWLENNLYDYDTADADFMTGYNEKWETSLYQAGILGVLGIGAVMFLECLLYAIIRSVIV